MSDLEGCQIPCLPNVSEGTVGYEKNTTGNRIKRLLAKPWNHTVKKYLKRALKDINRIGISLKLIPAATTRSNTITATPQLAAGDWVRIRPLEEIQATLDRWKELKGCAFIQDMWQYCGTDQQVLKPVERFLDERDYKVKKTRGLVLLKDLMCKGTPVFGTCDRSCHFFWRTEWLEKIQDPHQEQAKPESLPEL